MSAFTFTASSPLILYASETGNAEDVAYSLYRQWNYVFSKSDVQFRISSVEDYDVSNLPDESIVVFVLSTCGDGEFPIPMRTMWNCLLRKSLPKMLLHKMKFAVFGLGDSSYEKFNAAARKLYVRLQQLGAFPVVEFTLSLGDDQAGEGYLAALDPWSKLMTNNLHSLLVPTPESMSSSISDDNTLTAEAMRTTLTRYRIVLDSALSSNLQNMHPLRQFSEEKESWKVYRTKIIENSRITSPEWSQAIHHVTFTLDAETQEQSNFPSLLPSSASHINDLAYEAGDIAQIYYANPPILTEPLVQYFSRNFISHDDISVPISADSILHINLYDSAQPLSFRRSRLHHSISCSLVSLFRDVLDIGAIPKRSYFAALAVFSSNDEERDKLLEISTSRGADLYYDYCLRERRNYVEVLLDFASVNISLQYFVGLVPLIKPRPYSIASSPRYKHNSLELCVAVVQRVTPYRRKRTGLCSGFISQLSVDDVVYLRIQRGSFPHFAKQGKFPENMLLIGPGTGIAPMRAILQDRLLFSSAPQQAPSMIHVYFGCRRVGCDEIYASEWRNLNEGTNPYTDTSTRALSSSSCTVSVHVAHSQNIGQLVKVYVTHLLEQQAVELAKLLRSPDVFIGIAGSAKRMPKDVKQSLIRILMQGDPSSGVYPMNEEEAQQWLQVLVREKRLLVEAWG